MKDSYKGTWALLFVAFVAFFAYSAYDGDLTICGYNLKHTRLYHALLGNDSNAQPQAAKVTAEELVAAAPAQAVQLDTMPKTILFIGDSMLEGLSPRLAAYCQASGHRLFTVIWYSSTSKHWGSSDRLRTYLQRIKPDYVFICLGANELFVSDIIDKRTGFVRQMLADIGDIPYLWIGPPNWKEDTGINRMIADNVSPGSFFLSDGMQFDRKSDGAHPTSASAALWLDSVVRWMPRYSAHPIRLNTPDKATARPTRTYIHKPDE